jgi:hypothetical protein
MQNAATIKNARQIDWNAALRVVGASISSVSPRKMGVFKDNRKDRRGPQDRRGRDASRYSRPNCIRGPSRRCGIKSSIPFRICTG